MLFEKETLRNKVTEIGYSFNNSSIGKKEFVIKNPDVSHVIFEYPVGSQEHAGCLF